MKDKDVVLKLTRAEAERLLAILSFDVSFPDPVDREHGESLEIAEDLRVELVGRLKHLTCEHKVVTRTSSGGKRKTFDYECIACKVTWCDDEVDCPRCADGYDE